MLSAHQNELLTRVGGTTAMGRYMRRFWIPFYPADQLEREGQPRRVKLLGEDLVVFRDSEGRIGLVANRCPHRGAPLVFGRNEAGGLRCVYHGWKFDTSGSLVEAPAEPSDSAIFRKACVRSYPVVERQGVAWTYLGPRDEAPPLPDFEWNMVPRSKVHVSFRVQECNWLQALEGELDSAHAPILHSRIDQGGVISDWVAARDLTPSFETLRQPYGLSIASRRQIGEEEAYWRVNQFLLPFWTMVPPQSKFPELSGHAWVPIDDETTLCLMFSYVPAGELYPSSRELFENGYKGRETGHASRHSYAPQPATTPYADFWTRFSSKNAYQLDYKSQQTTWFSGLPGLWVQDAATQCGIEPIYDRTTEHLCLSDTGIVMMRRVLLEQLKAQERGESMDIAYRPEAFMARAVSLHLPVDADWRTHGAEPMRAELGKDFGYKP